MLFQDILDEKYRTLKPEFNRLFATLLKNQTHPGDLLLVYQNGFYDPTLLASAQGEEKYSPYMLGPGSDGHSEGTHYDYIGSYVKNNITDEPYQDYLNRVKYDPQNINLVEKVAADEGVSIQTEMIVYLKIWESNTFIKTFYEICLLLHGLPYDWHFKIKESNRDKKATGNRDKIIREMIRDKFAEPFPLIYSMFKNAFITQIRNSIAHSEYIISQRHITLNNYIREDDNAQLTGIYFDRWIDMFHDSIIIYSLYNEFLSHLLNHYEKLSIRNGCCLEVRINMLYPEQKTINWKVGYDPIFKIWGGNC